MPTATATHLYKPKTNGSGGAKTGARQKPECAAQQLGKEVVAQGPTPNPNYDPAKANARFTGVAGELSGKTRRGKQKEAAQDEE